VLEEAAQLPDIVRSADPMAFRAYAWLNLLMKEEVLANVLFAERSVVDRRITSLREYHNQRIHAIVEDRHSKLLRLPQRHASRRRQKPPPSWPDGDPSRESGASVRASSRQSGSMSQRASSRGWSRGSHLKELSSALPESSTYLLEGSLQSMEAPHTLELRTEIERLRAELEAERKKVLDLEAKGAASRKMLQQRGSTSNHGVIRPPRVLGFPQNWLPPGSLLAAITRRAPPQSKQLANTVPGTSTDAAEERDSFSSLSLAKV